MIDYVIVTPLSVYGEYDRIQEHFSLNLFVSFHCLI